MKVKTLQRSLLYAALGLFAVHFVLMGHSYWTRADAPSVLRLVMTLFHFDEYSFFYRADAGAVLGLLLSLSKLLFFVAIFAERDKRISKFLVIYAPITMALSLLTMAITFGDFWRDLVVFIMALLPLWMRASTINYQNKHEPETDLLTPNLKQHIIPMALLCSAIIAFLIFLFTPVSSEKLYNSPPGLPGMLIAAFGPIVIHSLWKHHGFLAAMLTITYLGLFSLIASFFAKRFNGALKLILYLTPLAFVASLILYCHFLYKHGFIYTYGQLFWILSMILIYTRAVYMRRIQQAKQSGDNDAGRVDKTPEADSTGASTDNLG